MTYKPLPKPKSTKEQVSVLWDIVTGHVAHKLDLADVQIKILLALSLTLLGVVIAKGF